jgi:hypothetical protein
MDNRVHQFHYGDFITDAAVNNLNGKTVIVLTGVEIHALVNLVICMLAFGKKSRNFLMPISHQPTILSNHKKYGF